MRSRNFAGYVLVSAILWAEGARADDAKPTDARADRALFEAARSDETAGRWGEALVKLRRVLAGRETAALRYHLAFCEEKIGLLASAQRDYIRAVELAGSTPGPDRKLIVERSKEALEALAPRVPQLVVRVLGKGAPPLARLDGEDFALTPDAAPAPVDPGHHTLDVSAPGGKTFRRDFVLKPHETCAVNVLFEPPTPSGVSAALAPRTPPAMATPPARPSVALPWALAGASAALGGVSVASFLAGRGQQRELDRCRAEPDVYLCDQGDIETTRARNFAFAGTAGALSLATAGTALWFAFGSSPRRASSHTSAAGGIAVSATGVRWSGTF